MTYHHTDLVDTITHGGRTADYTLDIVGGRIRTWTDNLDGTTIEHRHHYTSDADSPTWTQESATTWTRVISGLAGMCGTYQSDAGAVTWQLANLHGDLIASTETGTAGLTATYETTEYGLTRSPGDTGTRRYAWLGAKQRAADTPTGITLMGVRLYNPTSGRFTQTDPVPGGSCNPYDYTCADPPNRVDLDGRTWHVMGYYPSRRICIDAGMMAVAVTTVATGEQLIKEIFCRPVYRSRIFRWRWTVWQLNVRIEWRIIRPCTCRGRRFY